MTMPDPDRQPAARAPGAERTATRRGVLLFLAGAAVVAVVVTAYFIGRTHGSSAAPTPTPVPTSAPVTTSARSTPPPAPTSARPTSAEADPALAGAQQGLKQLGYYNGPVDGIDSPATRAAMTAFQTWARTQPFGTSVSVTGEFDPPTQYALNVALGGNADGPGSSSSADATS